MKSNTKVFTNKHIDFLRIFCKSDEETIGHIHILGSEKCFEEIVAMREKGQSKKKAERHTNTHIYRNKTNFLMYTFQKDIIEHKNKAKAIRISSQY